MIISGCTSGTGPTCWANTNYASPWLRGKTHARQAHGARFRPHYEGVLFRQEGANLEIGILASEEAQDFIEAHSSVLNGSFRKVEMSETMRKRLERSNYVFSGLKTFHELNGSGPFPLLDEKTAIERRSNVF